MYDPRRRDTMRRRGGVTENDVAEFRSQADRIDASIARHYAKGRRLAAASGDRLAAAWFPMDQKFGVSNARVELRAFLAARPQARGLDVGKEFAQQYLAYQTQIGGLSEGQLDGDVIKQEALDARIQLMHALMEWDVLKERIDRAADEVEAERDRARAVLAQAEAAARQKVQEAAVAQARAQQAVQQKQQTARAVVQAARASLRAPAAARVAQEQAREVAVVRAEAQQVVAVKQAEASAAVARARAVQGRAAAANRCPGPFDRFAPPSAGAGKILPVRNQTLNTLYVRVYRVDEKLLCYSGCISAITGADSGLYRLPPGARQDLVVRAIPKSAAGAGVRQYLYWSNCQFGSCGPDPATRNVTTNMRRIDNLNLDTLEDDIVIQSLRQFSCR